MTNTKLLEDYIDKSGYKRSHLAKALNITSYALALKITNKNEFKASEINTLCRVLDIPVEGRMSIFFA